MKISRYVVSLLLLSAPSLSGADPSLECGIENSTQVEIGACVNEQLEAVNQTLGVALKFATESAMSLDEITGREVSQPALVEGQNTWEAYRAKHCDFVGSTFGGGSGTGIAIVSCQIELGRDRIEELLIYSQ